MRHKKKKKILSRGDAKQRRSIVKNMAASLILHEKIKTTLNKARVIRPIVEKMVGRAKVDNLTNRRLLLAKLPAKNAVKKMFELIGPRYKERNGGYLRIIKTEPRKGDGAKMAIIEFVS
jgi:large subunit ribosomal protein L17